MYKHWDIYIYSNFPPFLFLIFFKKFIYFWLHWIFVAVHGLLIAVASLVAERRLYGDWASVVGSSWASLPCSMWNLPGPGIEPMSPALAGGFSATMPPGTPSLHFYVEGNMWYFIPCSFYLICHGVLSVPVHRKHPYSSLQLHFTPWMYHTY